MQIHHQKSKFHVTITSVHFKLEHSFFKVQDDDKSGVFFFSILVKGRKILSMRIYNESFHTSIVKKEEKKIQFFLPILTQRRKNVSMSIYRGAYPKCSGSFSHLQGESEHLEFVLLYNLNSAIF